ncbi:DivIVA domain-containing protein [Ruminococcus sp.]|uniref:DivIVA domain-containing protein n=1 Tax=Ruminococcus sp. TaxID=41978 RepID=UPI003EFD97BB
MITAKDIKNKSKKFEKAAFGYKQEEVDEFMQQLEADFRAMEHDLEDANAKIQLLADKVREYRADEDALKDALLGAQKQGKHVIAEANEKAAEILQEAQARAEQLNDEATRQHEQAMAANRAEIDREKQALIVAQNQVADFKKSLFDMYKAHLELISQMPEPDYDVPAEEEAAEEPEQPEEPVQVEEEPVLEDTPQRDPFATSQFSAKTIRGEYDSRFGDLHFGQKNNNAKDE